MSTPASDPESWGARRTTEVDQVFDLLADAPDGLDIDQIADELESHIYRARDRIRDLRHLLRGDSINVVCDPNGAGERWTYRLTGSVDDAREWQAHRMKHLESRLDTDHSVAASLVNGTDGRTVEGRKARYTETTIRHLIEQLALME